MQAAIIPLSVNLDKVLDKLNGTTNKKIRRKDMENIFDDIVKGEAGNIFFFFLTRQSVSILFNS